MLTASGNINQPYEVIGVITVSVVKPENAGCNKAGLPVDAAYQEAVEAITQVAASKNATGVIHIGFEHRVSSSATGCNQSATSNFELYCWGTAIRLHSP
jgi:hypothetical protein